MKRVRFIGENGSMGFQYGGIYELLSFTLEDDDLFWAKLGSGFPYRKSCPYSSLKKFLENWEEI